MPDVTSEYVKSVLNYEPDTGIFTWKHRPDISQKINGRFSGKIAGCKKKNGTRIEICLNFKYYPAHRLAWLYITGYWPKNEIDHINHNPLDNRFSNLREATRSGNSINRKTWGKLTGVKHVSYCSKSLRHYRVRIKANGKMMNFGSYETLEQAEIVAISASKWLHGEFSPFNN